MRLTDKQQKFADNFILNNNATESYKMAYPSCKKDSTARTNGSKLLTNTNILQYIDKIKQEIAERNKWTRDKLINEFESVKTKCMQEVEVIDRFGNPTGEYKFDSLGAIKSLENIGKLCGFYEEKVNHKGFVPVTIVDDI